MDDARGGPAGWARVGRMPVRLPVAVVVLVVGLTSGLVAVGAVSSDPRAAPAPASTPASTPGPAPVPGAAVAEPPPALAVLRGWDQRRAEAWSDADPGALARLYVPGSSAGATDVALLRRYRARGYSVRGMRMQLLAVRVLVLRPRLLRVEVTDRLAGATAVGATEQVLPTDAATTRVLVLRRVGGQWLMARVLPGSAGR